MQGAGSGSSWAKQLPELCRFRMLSQEKGWLSEAGCQGGRTSALGSPSNPLTGTSFGCSFSVCVPVDWNSWAVLLQAAALYLWCCALAVLATAATWEGAFLQSFLWLGLGALIILQSQQHSHWRVSLKGKLHLFECQRCVSYLHKHIYIYFFMTVLIFKFLGLCILGFE